MPQLKPFHRTVRGMKPASNAGYSGWAYILDREYSKAPDHYVRAYGNIQSDLQEIFQYVEPSPEGSTAFSYKIHALLMRTCIEVEANFKAILAENTYVPATYPNGKPRYDMNVYKKINTTHHLSSYELLLPMWNGPRRVWKPFGDWNGTGGVQWYQAYNASKHDRLEEFKKASLETLIMAVGGLLVLLSAQFKDQDFSAGQMGLGLSGYDYHEMEPSTGSLFRIKYPTDWTDDELYDFNWQTLASQPDRFAKIDYNAIP